MTNYYLPQVAPYVAVTATTRTHLQALLDTIPYEQPVALFTNEPQLAASPWVLMNRIDGFQIRLDQPTPEAQDSGVNLTEADIT